MQNLQDDNHLDNLSRLAAEEFEPDHELHSWEKLRPQLELALPQKKERKRRFFFFILLFLLVGGGVTLSTLWNGERHALAEKNSSTEKVNQEPAAPVETKKNTSVTPEKENKAAEAQQPVAKTLESISKPETFTTQQPKRVDTRINKSIVQKTKIDQPITKIEDTKIKQSKTGQPKTEESKTTEQPKTEQPKTEQPKAEETKIEQPKTGQPKTEQPKIDQPKAEQAKTDQAKADSPKAAEQQKTEQPKPVTTAKKETKQEPSTLKNRWEFGLAVAPDVTTVKFTHSQDPGTNIGFTVGYNLSKRFQIQTGAFYTSKNYKSYGKDYHPPKGYWTDYVKLETVTGECDMWDIPVNLRYNIIPRNSSNFFASAGLSSYFMRREYYDFFYYYNGNPVNRFRSLYTDNQHWFSVLNFSLGYERQVSKHVSLQAEPFFKQPLKGLGFGSVKMNSTGIYFSVKYKPFNSSKKALK
jgi:hypothetical protein